MGNAGTPLPTPLSSPTCRDLVRTAINSRLIYGDTAKKNRVIGFGCKVSRFLVKIASTLRRRKLEISFRFAGGIFWSWLSVSASTFINIDLSLSNPRKNCFHDFPATFSPHFPTTRRSGNQFWYNLNGRRLIGKITTEGGKQLKICFRQKFCGKTSNDVRNSTALCDRKSEIGWLCSIVSSSLHCLLQT